MACERVREIRVRGARMTLVEQVPPHRFAEGQMLREVMRVAQFWDVPVQDVCGKGRRERVALARFHAYAACRALGYSLPVIGRFFGRDHSTVLHGLRRLEALG